MNYQSRNTPVASLTQNQRYKSLVNSPSKFAVKVIFDFYQS